jgi:FkbM family methyltransferase
MSGRIKILKRWHRLVGFRSAIHWQLIRVAQILGFKGPRYCRLRPRQVQYPLLARLRGSTDMRVFYQIFVFEEYSCLRHLTNVSLVLDLGANVGFSSIYFLSCFPACRVIAVEPDAGNLEICEANLKPYGERSVLLHGAVWSEQTRLAFSSETLGSGKEWGRQVSASGPSHPGDIEAWDVGTLIARGGGGYVDLLKVDIEGAEIAVFGESAGAWLPLVRNICIELHNPACSEMFFEAIAGYHYELQTSGELTIVTNLRAREDLLAG